MFRPNNCPTNATGSTAATGVTCATGRDYQSKAVVLVGANSQRSTGNSEQSRKQSRKDLTVRAVYTAQPRRTCNAEGIDPNTLSPTYSMVSYCPFIGKCGFFPIIYDQLRAAQDEPCCVQVVPATATNKAHKSKRKCRSRSRPKTALESKYVQTIEPYPDCLRREQSFKITEAYAQTSVLPFQPGKTEQLIVFTQESTESVYEPRDGGLAGPQEQEICVILDVPLPPPVPVCEPPPIPLCEPPPSQQKELKQVVRSREKTNEKLEEENSIFAERKIETEGINLQVIRQESNMAFKSRNKLETGISGLRVFAEDRSKQIDGGQLAQPMDFIDYFVQNDGCKYIGVLEQLYVKYLEKVQTELAFGTSSHLKKKSDEAHAKISEFYKITQVELEKQLQDYDFPTVLENDTSKFRIEYMSKVVNIGKMHNYGVKMILYWLRLLETRQKPIDPMRIYTVATELMAEIMVLCYSLFVRIAEFIGRMAEDATEDEVAKYTLKHLTHCFRNLVDCICDEMGAIGESCGQVMIRIPNLTRHTVVETMTTLYTQINYADVSISRAIEALTPILHLYYLRYFIEERQPSRKR